VSRPVLESIQTSTQSERQAPFPGVNMPGCETDHSSPPSAEVRNAWSYTSTPTYVFAQGQLDNFTLFRTMSRSYNLSLLFGFSD